MGNEISRLEIPCERVSIITAQRSTFSLIPRLAGVHKAAPLIETIDEKRAQPSSLVNLIAENIDAVPTLSMSSYGVGADDHEALVRALLDEFRRRGFRKTHLLRPKGYELRAGDVLSRRSLDVIAFPYHGAFGLGPTVWVPDTTPLRERGTRKPAPHSEISMSPRLAALLLNLAGLSPGRVVLDPFCGSGTVLAEALMRSCRCLGFDSDEKRVRDARRNLSWTASRLRGSSFNVRVGDARNLRTIMGETKVDAVVTEPLLLPALDSRPKTETAAALMEDVGDVYADALASIAEVLFPGGRIVIVVPVVMTMDGEEVTISLDGRPLGLRLHQPGPIAFEYPVRLSFESTRWVRRAVYVFESWS